MTELTRPIVLATDGSPSATEATLWAVDLAHRLEAPLAAIAVEHVEIPAYAYFGYAEVVRDLRRIVDEHLDATLDQVAAVAREHGVICDVEHAHGSVVEQINRFARDVDAQMLVVGVHGWGPVARAFHGSVSSALLQHAPCPVLVVPAGVQPLVVGDPVAVPAMMREPR